MNIAESLIQYHLPLVILWFVCLATYLPLMGSRALWRLGLPPFFLAVFGFLIYWFPIYQAGGAPGFYGVWDTDADWQAFMMWAFLVLPALVLQAPALACAEWLRTRTLNERARSANGPGSYQGLTRAPYL